MAFRTKSPKPRLKDPGSKISAKTAPTILPVGEDVLFSIGGVQVGEEEWRNSPGLCKSVSAMPGQVCRTLTALGQNTVHAVGMTIDLLAGLASFAFVTSITPGPNNLMLLSSGANFGFRRTLPHMAGISLGFALMASALGIGFVGVFERYPRVYFAMMLVSVVYLVYLAWRIATAAPPEGRVSTGKPLTLVQAALFQWVNPKVWAMAVTAVTVYTEERTAPEVILVAVIFAMINLPSVSIWALIGQQLRRWLSLPGRLRVFNIVMAVLLLLSLYPALMSR